MIKIAAMRAKSVCHGIYMLNHAQQESIYKNNSLMNFWGKRSQFISDANLTRILYLLRRDRKKNFG